MKPIKYPDKFGVFDVIELNNGMVYYRYETDDFIVRITPCLSGFDADLFDKSGNTIFRKLCTALNPASASSVHMLEKGLELAKSLIDQFKQKNYSRM